MHFALSTSSRSQNNTDRNANLLWSTTTNCSDDGDGDLQSSEALKGCARDDAHELAHEKSCSCSRARTVCRRIESVAAVGGRDILILA